MRLAPGVQKLLHPDAPPVLVTIRNLNTFPLLRRRCKQNDCIHPRGRHPTDSGLTRYSGFLFPVWERLARMMHSIGVV